MTNNPIYPILDINEFTTFLLIYASHVDYDFSDNEKSFILERIDNDTFDRMFDLFNDNTDYTCLKIILNHKSKYFKNERQQGALFNLLKDIFEVDGEFSRIEKNFVPFFEKMINLKDNES